MDSDNIFDHIPATAAEELIANLISGEHLKVERIVSFGQASPADFWYDQDTREWVMVLRGRAGLEFEGDSEILEMRAGDYVDIPAHKRHRVAWTAAGEPTVWLAIHY